jgi:two-component system, LytTR family, response regulator
MDSKKVIIVDDEALARALLAEYLTQFPMLQIVAQCSDGFEAIKAVQQHNPDLIFLDIQMPKLNGFEMLELLDEPPAVIFTTAFEEYAIKAFDANAIDYLLKPFSEDRLEKAISKFLNNQMNTNLQALDAPLVKSFQAPRIVVKDNHQIHIIPFEDIIYLEAADDYVKIHTANRYFLKKKTMAYFEEMLPAANFCRVHRSYIVSLAQIGKVEPWEKDGAIITLKYKPIEISVSKAGYVRLKEALKW